MADSRGTVDTRTAPRRKSRFTGKIVREHIILAEQALGKALPAGVQVHHVDDNHNNNSPGNLVVCPDQAYHRLLHTRWDAMLACGNPDYRKCVVCKEYDTTSNMKFRSHDNNYHHWSCINTYNRNNYKGKST